MLAGCTPAQKLARHYGVNKKELRSRVLVTKGATTGLRRSAKGIYTLKQTTSAKSTNTLNYARIKALKHGKFYGPYVEKDSTVYYLWRLKSEQRSFTSFIITQFHQPFGIGNKRFQKRLDDILASSLASADPAQALNDFPDDDEISVGTVFSKQEERLEALRPQAIAFLKSADVLAYNQADKVQFPNTTITEVLIKTAPIANYEYLNYAKVIIREPLLKHPK